MLNVFHGFAITFKDFGKLLWTDGDSPSNKLRNVITLQEQTPELVHFTGKVQDKQDKKQFYAYLTSY